MKIKPLLTRAYGGSGSLIQVNMSHYEFQLNRGWSKNMQGSVFYPCLVTLILLI